MGLKLRIILVVLVVSLCSPILAEDIKAPPINVLPQKTAAVSAQKSTLEKKKRASLFWSDHKIKTIGIWVEAEGPAQPLNDQKELNKLIDIIKNQPISNLYVQVYRNGRSWFPSLYADDAPFKKVNQNGLDPLKEILNAAKSKENPAKVYVWFNALRLGEDPEAKVLKYLGKDAVLLSSRGESLLDSKGQGRPGCRPDTPGIWLDPNNKRVPALLLNLFLEVTSRYPDIDGIHLDMIRRPFPYSPNETIDKNCSEFLSIDEYQKKKIAVDELESRAMLGDSNSVEEESEDLVKGPTIVIKKFRRVFDRIFPQYKLTAAVLSNQQKAVKHANQNWPMWVEDALVDEVVTMLYTDDMHRFKREALEARDLGPEKVSIGVGAWLALNNPSLLTEQVKYVKEIGANGVVLFSHGNLAGEKGSVLYEKVNSVVFSD